MVDGFGAFCVLCAMAFVVAAFAYTLEQIMLRIPFIREFIWKED